MANPSQPEQGDDDKFPIKQLLVLAVCRIAEPIAFTSIIAYTFLMVQEFEGIDKHNASFYAGLLISAFAVAEACTAMTWGSISDRYGRKPIILTGLAGTALSSLLFGFATNIWVALAARVVGGLLNGNVAVMQTMVAELCKKPEWEPKAYTMPPFMWSFGVIIGAAMGGFLAQPAHYYPSIFSPDGLFGRYPYLLPNLVAVVAILIAIVQGYFLLEETNPKLVAGSKSKTQRTTNVVNERTPLRPGPRKESVNEVLGTSRKRPSFASGSMPTVSEPGFNLRRGSIATIHSVKPIIQESAIIDDQDDTTIEELPTKTFTRDVLLWTAALVIMCYDQMAFGALIPVYLLDQPRTTSSLDLVGGLGYTVHDVGVFMSVNGLVALFVQLTIFPFFVSRVGVWNSIRSLVIICPLAYVFVPFLSLIHGAALPFGVYAALTFQNFLMIVIYPCILIALKNATPSPLVLGRVNGLAMSACSGARTIAPPLVGAIYSAGGAAMAWWSIAVVAIIGVVELAWLSYPKDNLDVVIENVLSRVSTRDQTSGTTHEERHE